MTPPPESPFRPSRRRMKALVDRAGATLLLVLAAPWLLLVALALWSAIDGPVLHRDRRRGQHGHPFDLLRFRTAPWAGPDGELRGLGRFLLRSHLDQLPRLLNVARGDMSLVGPQPRVWNDGAHPSTDATAGLKPGLVRVPEPEDGVPPEGEAATLARYAREWTLGTDLRILSQALLAAVHHPERC